MDKCTLKHSTGSIGTVSDISKHSEEIEGLLAGDAPAKLIATDELVEDPSILALEKHLEDSLVQNWASAKLGKAYDIFNQARCKASRLIGSVVFAVLIKTASFAPRGRRRSGRSTIPDGYRPDRHSGDSQG